MPRSFATHFLAHPCLIAAVAAVGGHALAGPLTPPAGPVAPTPGPEPRIAINAANTPGDADSLFKISQPGSYYLAENITGVVGKHGIEVAAAGVTIDLNGFELAGVPNMGNVDGIASSTSGSVRIRNGSVRAWGGDGIDLFGTNASTVTDVRATENTGYGIRGSNRSIIQSCIASNNLGNGIRGSAGSIIESCIAAGNTLNGIEVTSGCVVLQNNCYINGNGGDGAGILAAGADNRIEGNNCTGADRGIDVNVSGNFIVKNTCSGNTNNWDIAANNVCGPVLDRTSPASAAITGNAGASSLGSTDANANFSF